MRSKIVYALMMLSLFGMSGCTAPGEGAYFNPGDPENQLMMINEQLYIDLSQAGSIQQLQQAINMQPPSRATVNCPLRQPLCKKARMLLDKAKIPYNGKEMGSILTLYYEDIVGHDCHSGYIENARNPYNLHHSSFGCSLRANTVQMVSDKQQFINPQLLGYMDGEKAADIYDSYRQPSSSSESSGDTDATLLSAE